MKLSCILLITLITLLSCKKNRDINIVSCKKNNFISKDTTFFNSEILSSVYFNSECKINKIKLFVLLDDRSGNLKDTTDLNDVVIKLGFHPDTLINIIIPGKQTSILKKENSYLLQLEYAFKSPFLDSINLIDLKTISFEKSENKRNLLKSSSYFYNESKSILGVDKTYLDYKAFIKNNVRFKNISKSPSKVDSILITVKPRKSIDNITKYNLILNDTLILNFRNSIHANFKNPQTTDKNIIMYDLLKCDKNFISFKLNLSKLNLHYLDSINVKLD
ncbi:hypothetical protein Q4566_15010 [Tamlana sp. 2_MG-2023]|uniref:hypothetical protein n=1 Tax=unclassified Tamlana TaxID=2614803 RepID=UPI0026E28F8A|nr:MULTISPECIES: hypothetical protein [unclassified Tamlana]MDO6761520.1 hypothetical protein [Tamlana sp. 2_MG-2023]MDO6792386.1 hypothetical protein [Tamlana sp. 1_MG-2023]